MSRRHDRVNEAMRLTLDALREIEHRHWPAVGYPASDIDIDAAFRWDRWARRATDCPPAPLGSRGTVAWRRECAIVDALMRDAGAVATPDPTTRAITRIYADMVRAYIDYHQYRGRDITLGRPPEDDIRLRLFSLMDDLPYAYVGSPWASLLWHEREFQATAIAA